MLGYWKIQFIKLNCEETIIFFLINQNMFEFNKLIQLLHCNM